MTKEKIAGGGIEKSDNSFEAQFANRERIKVPGGTAEVVDIKPEAAKTEIPVFFGPAWGCTLEVYKPTLEKLAGLQRRVISLDHPRLGGSMSNVPEETIEKYPQEELRKALNVLEVLDAKKVDKTDAIAHSEAAINVAIAAVLRPEKFRNIVFFSPAGMIGKDKFIRLLQGFAGQSKRAESYHAAASGEEIGWQEIPVTETEKEVGADAAREAVKYLTKNPVRAIREAKEISDSQIHDMLRYLHEKGIGIVVVNAVDDPVFPPEKMQAIAKADMLDGFLSIRGGHGAIGDHPELFVPAVEKMLTALEERGAKTR